MDNFIANLTSINVAKAGAILLMAHMFYIGLWAYVAPQGLCQFSGLRHDGQHFFGKPKHKISKSSRAVQDAGDEHENFWPYLFAPREIGFGLSILILSAIGEWRAVGVLVGVVGGLLATTDGWVAGVYGKGGWKEVSYSHALPGVVLCWISYILLSG